ncbi:MAG: stage III sporulation protein AF [Clostridiales bacterium]|nr:stage III sporulation protein AF [Clostridiales bacterium]
MVTIIGSIYDWVKSIVFFLVLISVINNLLGSSSYKKYINLISGMILIILVVSPLLRVFDIDEKIDYYFEKNTFMADSQDINNDLIKIEQSQMSSIMEEYKKEIKSNAARLLEKEGLYISSFNVKINEDENSRSFGTIEKIDIVAAYTYKEESNLLESIDKVEIDRIEIGQKNQEENNDNIKLSETEIYIKNLLSDFYNVDFDNINISIQGY